MITTLTVDVAVDVAVAVSVGVAVIVRVLGLGHGLQYGDGYGDGRELAKRLQTLHPRMRHLFMSGYTADVIAYCGVLDHDVHILLKPFPTTVLAATAREALDWRAWGQGRGARSSFFIFRDQALTQLSKSLS